MAKFILKTCAKQNFKYSNLFAFCFIGLMISVILKIFKFELEIESLELIICLIINIVIFIIFKCKDKIVQLIHKWFIINKNIWQS